MATLVQFAHVPLECDKCAASTRQKTLAVLLPVDQTTLSAFAKESSSIILPLPQQINIAARSLLAAQHYHNGDDDDTESNQQTTTKEESVVVVQIAAPRKSVYRETPLVALLLLLQKRFAHESHYNYYFVPRKFPLG